MESRYWVVRLIKEKKFDLPTTLIHISNKQIHLLRNCFTMASTQTRFSATIKVNPDLMSKLIGMRGSNIRRITGTVRNGCYIRGEKDTFTIQAYTEDAVKKAAKMLHDDHKAFSDPDSFRSKPIAQFVGDTSCIGHLIGRDGSGLKSIMKQIGDGCYIVHKEGAFHVTANTSDDVERAIGVLRQQNRDCLAWQEKQKEERARYHQQKQEESKPKTNLGNNGFAAIATSDSEDEEPTPVVKSRKHYRRGTRVGGLFPSGKVEELKSQRAAAYKMRALLAEMRSCPIEEVDWRDVDREIARMQPTKTVQERVQERPDTSSLLDFPQENVQLTVAEKPKWGNGKGRDQVMSGHGETYHVPALVPPPPAKKDVVAGPVPRQIVQLDLTEMDMWEGY